MIYTHCARHLNVRHIQDILLQKLCNAQRPCCLIGVKPRVGRVFLLGIHFEGSACLRKYIYKCVRARVWRLLINFTATHGSTSVAHGKSRIATMRVEKSEGC